MAAPARGSEDSDAHTRETTMRILYALAPGELRDEPDEGSLTWEPWESEMRRCIICGDDADTEWTDAGYGCKSARACIARFKAKEKAQTATPARTAA